METGRVTPLDVEEWERYVSLHEHDDPESQGRQKERLLEEEEIFLDGSGGKFTKDPRLRR